MVSKFRKVFMAHESQSFHQKNLEDKTTKQQVKC